MVWEKCTIKLNSDSTESFYCGDIVTGTVILKFKRNQKIERIEFLVSGTSKASWTTPSPTIPHIKFYSQKKKVLHISINLFDNLQGQLYGGLLSNVLYSVVFVLSGQSNRYLLPRKIIYYWNDKFFEGTFWKGKIVGSGEFEYPFHFALPHDLPSSFESSIARVYYCIKIKFSGACRDKKIQPFVVLGNVNLNIEKYLGPYCQEIHRGKVSLLVKTYIGFSSKQRIPVAIIITNEKQEKIYKLSVSLIQKLRYSVLEGHADEEKKMCKVTKKDFQSLEKESCCLNLDIPHVVPSSIHTQDPMIAISYIFRIQIKFAFHHKSLFEDIPVSVATIPVLHYDFCEC